MSSSSLARMSVPVAGDQSASNQGLLMPKLKYRFRVLFDNLGVSKPTTELTKQVQDCTRPTLTHESIPIHVYNSMIRIAGKHTWNDITVTVRDDISNNVARLVGEQMQKQMDHMEQASAASGIDYKFTMRIEMLDGGNGKFEPTIFETWELYGCWIQSTNYSDLNYAASEYVTLQINIQYDNALQTPLGTGIGTDVGRTLGELATG